MMMRRHAAALAALLLAGPALAVQLVVVQSSSRQYEVRKLVASDKPIQLAEGEEVTLVSPAGKSYKLKGPYQGSPTAESAGGDDKTRLKGALSSLFGKGGENVAAAGAIRGGPDEEAEVDRDVPVWRLVPGADPAQCVVEGAPAVLWRRDASAEADVILRDVAHDRAVELVWPAGSHDLGWPDTLPRIDGAIYLLRDKDALRSSSLVVRELSAEAASGPQAVAWLAAMGCERQARRLLGEVLEVER